MFFSSVISVECVVAYEASSGLDDGAKVINAENRLFTWRTPPPSRLILWGQIGNECAYSMPHINAGGYASAVEMCFGDKLWFVAWFSVQNLKRRPEKCAKWECVRLERGHRLYMPPGMLHFEITIKDSFEMGGHFFSYSTMRNTMEAMVAEHFYGKSWTNAEVLTSPIVLFKMVDDIRKAIYKGERSVFMSLCAIAE